MSQEVVQWLGEIRALKQRLAELEHQKTEAEQGAAKWRQLYSTEAQQRRTESRLAQRTVRELEAEIQQLKGNQKKLPPNSPEALAAIEEEVAAISSFPELRDKLATTMKEKDLLAAALKQERQEHAKTRKSLTSVIGDTIDQLAKHKAASKQENPHAETTKGEKGLGN